jgi:hypothetical protein
MHEKINNLIRALRDELQQYGEMLVRLDQHQQYVAHQSGGHLGESAGDIQIQCTAIQRARQAREHARRAMAGKLQLEVEVPIEKIISLLPADYQPLVNALVQENRELLAQVLQSLQCNQFLLARSLDRMQHFLNSVFPDDFDKNDSMSTQKAIHIPVIDSDAPELFEVGLDVKNF